MKTIHIATPDGRNARVALLRGRSTRPKTVKVTDRNEEVFSRHVHRGAVPLDLSRLHPHDLIDGDPDVDLANLGRLRPDCTRAYRHPGADTIEGAFDAVITTLAADGSIKKREPDQPRRANINDITPLRLGRRIPVVDVLRRFVVQGIHCLAHDDGLQYLYLYELAKDLESKGEAMLLGAGPKGDQPLVLRDRGNPVRAFLVGTTEGDRYRLRLLTTRQDLRRPAAAAPQNA